MAGTVRTGRSAAMAVSLRRRRHLASEVRAGTVSAMSSSRLVVAVDGSSLGNPGPGGWSWFVDATRWAAGAAARTTNNAMELTAVAEALAAVPSARAVELVCDSRYVIDCCTKWCWGWRRRGWVTAAGAPVKNRDLVELIVSLMGGREVAFTWVKGHAGHPLNESADRWARRAAEAGRAGRLVNVGPGWERRGVG